MNGRPSSSRSMIQMWKLCGRRNMPEVAPWALDSQQDHLHPCRLNAESLKYLCVDYLIILYICLWKAVLLLLFFTSYFLMAKPTGPKVTYEKLEGMFFLDCSANMQSTETLIYTRMWNYLRDLFQFVFHFKLDWYSTGTQKQILIGISCITAF